MRITVPVFIAGVLLGGAVSGLDPELALTQYGHTAWRVREGFFPGPLLAIAQTTDGYLWLGGEVGLIRFDGVHFMPWQPPEPTPLPDERIYALLGARDGSLWIGTSNGLARWHEGKLTVLATVGRFGALVEDRRGTIWAGHTRALSELPPLCRMESGEFRCLGAAEGFPLRYVGALHEDAQGDLWIGGEGGVCRWRSEEPECHEIEVLEGLADKTGVFSLAMDSDGTLWAGAGPTGTWRLAAGGWQGYAEPWEPRLESAALLPAHGGGLWIGTESHGLLRRTRGRSERFTRADGLSSDAVTTVFEDREGNLWVTTAGGLDRFRDVEVATLTRSEGLQEGTVLAVTAARRGGVWIAERRSLDHLEGGRISFWGAAEGLPGNGPTSLLEDSRGRLWLGLDNGLAWREHDRFFKLAMPDGSALGVVVTMVEDRERDLWVSTTDPRHALVRVRDERVVEVLPEDRFGGYQVRAMVADPAGGLWIALNDSGLRRYEEGKLELLPSIGEEQGSWVRGLLLGSHGLWLATRRGLGLLKDGEIAMLDAHRGLPCNDLEALVMSDDGALWLKSTCGLVRIAASELAAWVEQPEKRVEVQVWDAFDGAQAGLPPFSPVATRSIDGKLWFAIEGGGLQVIDPARMKKNPIPPPVQILRVVADGKAYEPGARLPLPALTKDLEIDYTALSLTLPEKVHFRYQLEGADASWQDVGTRRSAFYTNLAPGDYRFRVIACNDDGVWNQDGATLALAILPAFHQTRSFFWLCILAIAGLGWAIYRWRVRQVERNLDRKLEERLAERTRIAQELHDTLLQGFLSASMQLHVAVADLPAELPARRQLHRVQQLMGQLIEEGRHVLRGLRSPDRGIDDLERALARVPDELGLEKASGLSVLVIGQTRPLRPAARDEVYRIAREALVNALRHSEAEIIEAEVDYGTRWLRVSVRDDGSGIEAEVLHAGRDGHWGLSGMRERAERIGARLELRSRAGAGTEVELAVPATIAFADDLSVFSRWWRSLLPNRRERRAAGSEGG